MTKTKILIPQYSSVQVETFTCGKFSVSIILKTMKNVSELQSSVAVALPNDIKSLCRKGTLHPHHPEYVLRSIKILKIFLCIPKICIFQIEV